MKAARALLLGLPFVLVAIGGQVFLPRLADKGARAIGKVLALAPDPGIADAGARSELEELADPGEPTPAPNALPGKSVAPRARRDGSAPHVIFITGQAAARAIKSRAVRVVPSHGAIAGVTLFGISPLGMGLEDGDVVTAIEGEPTPDIDAASQAITRALGHGKKTVHGSIVRHGETYAVRVEIPDSTGP